LERLAGYAAPAEPGGAGGTGRRRAARCGAAAGIPGAAEEEAGIWGKWVPGPAGGVVALVVGLLVAQNVGDDKLYGQELALTEL